MATAASLSSWLLLALPPDTLGLKTIVSSWYLRGDSWGNAIMIHLPTPDAYFGSEWPEAHSKCSLNALPGHVPHCPGFLVTLIHLPGLQYLAVFTRVSGRPEEHLNYGPENKIEMHCFLIEPNPRSLSQGFFKFEYHASYN